jgi:hypothetical protein
MADESPSREPTTDPAAASSDSSGRSSAASDPFAGDAGPGFTPGTTGEPGAEPGEPGGLPGWPEDVAEEQVRSILLTAGDALHALAGVGELDWRFTPKDQDRLAPPMTRIVNRYETARALAGHSDELAVAFGMGLYGWRSMLERRAVLQAIQEGREPPAPASSPAPARPAPGPHGPAPAPPTRPPASPPPVPEPGPMPASGPEPEPPAWRAPDELPDEAEAATVEVAPGYQTAADRLRATRPPGG